MKASNVMKHISVDIESEGTVPNGTILAIGAWVHHEPWDESDYAEGGSITTPVAFHRVISRKSCLAAGLKTDPATLDWWAEPDQQPARDYLFDPVGLPLALSDFAQWLGPTQCVALWAYPPTFVMALLDNAYGKVGLPLPWSRGNQFCLRTMARFGPADVDIHQDRDRHPHYALYDAYRQGRAIPAEPTDQSRLRT